MEIYLDHKIEDASLSHTTLKTYLTWHKTHPLLCVTSYDQERGGIASMYGDDGSTINFDISSRFALQITTMAWHPFRKLIAFGWENGEIIIWNGQHEVTQNEVSSKHQNSISHLEWGNKGSILVSIDVSGICIGWKIDSQDQLDVLFYHELKDTIVDVIFRKYKKSGKDDEIARLVKAAVSGDEDALNMFCDWRSPVDDQSSTGSKESNDFFLGSSSGVIYYVSENGSCSEVLQTDSGVRKLLHYCERNRLIVVTEMLSLAQYQISDDGTLMEYSKVKLSGKSSEVNVIWTCTSILAVSSGEKVVRLWNLETSGNSVLSLDDANFSEPTEVLTCMAYDNTKSVLSAGTSHGHVIIWKYKPSSTMHNADVQEEENWELQPVITVHGAVRILHWGSSKRLLGVLTATDTYILSEEKMSFHFRDQVAAVQLSARQMNVLLLSLNVTMSLHSDVHIRAVFVCSTHVGISSGSKLHFYEISSDNKSLTFIGAFNSKSHIVALHENSTYLIENSRIEVRTFQGTAKQNLIFTEEEGPPICMDMCGNFLVSGTANGFVKMWDLSRREAKPHAGPRSLTEILKDDGEIASVRCNVKGNKVSISFVRISGGETVPDPMLYVWDLDSDAILHFDFSGRKEDTLSVAESSTTPNSPAWKMHDEAAKIVSGRYPSFHIWDPDNPQLLVCEAKLQSFHHRKEMRDIETCGKIQTFSHNLGWDTPEVMVVSFFTTIEQGLLIQDNFVLNEAIHQLLGVQVPYYILLQKSHTSNKSIQENKPSEQLTDMHQSSQTVPAIVKQTMKDFSGLESCDKVTRDAIMAFSFYLTIGNMDEAFKAIRVIRNESVWENMARMCVKTKRLDVASVCLGKMGHARGARALREVADESELDVRVAVLAIQLGMLEEAEHLLINCGRYDQLNKLYQDSGQWTKAIQVAELHDRVHLRSTYYNYAHHLESMGDITGAISMYEKSETHHFEIPRMLFDEPHVLESYILKSKDKELHKWWAQYLESIGEMETALQFYEAAQDYLSLVRLYCYCNNLEKAAEIANETGDRAACFHLGRQFENQDNIKEAVHFFSRAHAYNNAVRICKEHNLEDQLLNLALMSGPQEMNEVAKYYEERPGQQDKAIMLYHKAGYLMKAVDLAFRTREFGALQTIASDLGEDTDPQLLRKCAQFFLENGQYDKAVDLLAIAKKYLEALELCIEHNVIVTEDLAEKLTLPKDHPDTNLRTQILEKIGECCMLQDNYHMAAKKFTQAGKKVQAMKALLKSGDTEKIIFFAGVSRQREIYVMAANYLQSLDWRQDPEVIKNIVNFYTKGKALDLLAGFYEACAQVETDEYQNYEKALGALHEAYTCLSKARNNTGAQMTSKMENLSIKIELLRRFVQARQLYTTSKEESIHQCRTLLEEENVDVAIHKGDIYSFLVEHYVAEGNYKMAYGLIEEAQAKLPGINIPYYINADTLKTIYKALNIQPVSQMNFISGEREENIAEVSDDDEVEEEYQVAENGY